MCRTKAMSCSTTRIVMPWPPSLMTNSAVRAVSSGMTPEETARTAEFVIKLGGQGITILVVEHDMAFVRHIASGVTVLHYGRVFADGTLKEIEANHEVRRIYLGEQ